MNPSKKQHPEWLHEKQWNPFNSYKPFKPSVNTMLKIIYLSFAIGYGQNQQI